MIRTIPRILIWPYGGRGLKLQFNSVSKFKEQTLDEFERSLLVESIRITSI